MKTHPFLANEVQNSESINISTTTKYNGHDFDQKANVK